VVGQLVGGNAKEIPLQRPRLVVVRQAREKPDEGVLHDVLGRGPYGQAGLDERQQTAFISRDQLAPHGRIPLPNASDEHAIKFLLRHDARAAELRNEISDGRLASFTTSRNRGSADRSAAKRKVHAPTLIGDLPLQQADRDRHDRSDG